MVRVRADDGGGGICRALAAVAARSRGRRRQRVAVYRDQLDEIARDRASGLIGEAEAEAAKIEVSRRLIAAADSAQAVPNESAGSPLRRRRATAVAALLSLPLGAAALYLAIGSPQLPGAPLAERLAAAHENAPIAKLIAQVETHLEKNPDDARGYAVLAPVYLRLGRFADAVNANRKVIALSGETAQRQADLGEALTASANGIVTVEAKTAFERAVALDNSEPKARFFIGVAAEQDGDKAKAAAIWRDMLAQAPPGAPWAATVQQALASIGEAAPAPPLAAAPPGPSAADVAAAANMSEKDRGEMIRGMVAGSPPACSRTATISTAGSVCCAPIWCWASATRRKPPPAMRARRWPAMPTSFARSRTRSRAWDWKADDPQAATFDPDRRERPGAAGGGRPRA